LTVVIAQQQSPDPEGPGLFCFGQSGDLMCGVSGERSAEAAAEARPMQPEFIPQNVE